MLYVVEIVRMGTGTDMIPAVANACVSILTPVQRGHVLCSHMMDNLCDGSTTLHSHLFPATFARRPLYPADISYPNRPFSKMTFLACLSSDDNLAAISLTNIVAHDFARRQFIRRRFSFCLV